MTVTSSATDTVPSDWKQVEANKRVRVLYVLCPLFFPSLDKSINIRQYEDGYRVIPFETKSQMEPKTKPKKNNKTQGSVYDLT